MRVPDDIFVKATNAPAIGQTGGTFQLAALAPGEQTKIEGRLFRLGKLEQLELVIAAMHLHYARRQIGDASADRRIVAQIGQDNELLALAADP